MNYGTILAANKPPEQAVNLFPHSALSTQRNYDGNRAFGRNHLSPQFVAGVPGYL
jgi:hypothetical protein